MQLLACVASVVPCRILISYSFPLSIQLFLTEVLVSSIPFLIPFTCCTCCWFELGLRCVKADDIKGYFSVLQFLEGGMRVGGWCEDMDRSRGLRFLTRPNMWDHGEGDEDNSSKCMFATDNPLD